MLLSLGTRGALSPALAAWGHDLIYDPQTSDNEGRSAAEFDRWLAAVGALQAVRTQVYALIPATWHATAPESRAAALLVDADRAILGAGPARFAAYDASIRREYA